MKTIRVMTVHTLVFLFAVAALVSWSSTFYVRKLAERIGCIDEPTERKLHAAGTPRLGGLAIVLGFAAPLLLLPIDRDAAALVSKNVNYLFAVLTSGSLIVALGVYDDLFGSDATKKFAVQFAAAGILVSFGFHFEKISIYKLGDIDLGWFGAVVSILWIVGVINAMNLIDGMDGLATLVALTIAASFAVISLIRGDVLTLVIMTTLAGALTGFFPWNSPPAKIFMGDTGSLFIGLLLAASSIARNSKSPTLLALTGPALALALPVVDTLLVMQKRFRLPENSTIVDRFRMMFNADRRHIHHILIERTGSQTKALLTIWLVTICFSAAAITSVVSATKMLGYALGGAGILLLLLARHWGAARQSERTIRFFWRERGNDRLDV